MRQRLDYDVVDVQIAAPPATVFPLIADVTRMVEFSPYIRRVEWLDGTTQAAVGARFKAVNAMGRGPAWSNKPVITATEPNRLFAFRRTEPLMGTLEWRYRFEERDGGTHVTMSYRVIEPVTALGWFVIGTVYRIKDDRATLRVGMQETLQRLRAVAETRIGRA